MVIQETSAQPGRDKLRGIFIYAHLFGPWHLFLMQGRSGEQRPVSPADLRDYHGIIVGQMMLDLGELLRRATQPVVLMDPRDEVLKPGSPFARFSRTLDDSDAVGQAAGDYFLERRYEHFAYVGDPLARDWSIRRGQGFARRLRRAGHRASVYAPGSGDRGWRHDEAALARWLGTLPRPLALLAAMDARAHQVIRVCAEIGLWGPDDVAVLGVDDDELLCNGSIPSLSSIRRDTEFCGFSASRMLDRLMRGQTGKPHTVRYGVCGIVTRDSTRPDAVPNDPIVRQARECIRVNAGEPIGVPDVVRHLPYRVGTRRSVSEPRVVTPF